MFHPSPAPWLALLSLFASGAAVAQTHVHLHSDAPARAHATAEPAAPTLAYRSAFDGYRPFADDKPTPWTQANGAAGQGAAHSPMPAEPAAAPPGTGKPDPHAGHAMPMAMPMPSHHQAHP